MKKTLTVNGREVEFTNERNLLEVIRKAGIEIPTFCYHSELSIYGACRLCIIDIDGRGVLASCSTTPEPGMNLRTDTTQIREMRKINIELLLANHNRECPTCVRSSSCALQDVARRLGVEEVRYKQLTDLQPIDDSSPSLTRDPNKCVLCGDCVRVCSEVQDIGAIGFAHRGSKSQVAPAFDQNLDDVECVNCGQCAAVCPTGAIIPKQDREPVWKELLDTDKTVVVQVAPAVRTALGEYFGLEPGVNVAGKLVAALRMMGFDQVYDTSFAADMTIFEEATEFIDRLSTGGTLPMFTSCCPGWVKYAETFYPELLPNLSSCRSPQQMFGSVAKKVLPTQLNVDREKLVVVSVMPCTAKKYEAQLDKFKQDDQPDVDYVLTTTEVGRMINAMGLKFNELEPEGFDLPLGFSTGGGVIFGASGGVMEAALRFAAEKVEGRPFPAMQFDTVRGREKTRTASIELAGHELKVAVVHTLGEARKLAEEVARGESDYHFVEVMACPGGCISGAGQPNDVDDRIRAKRAEGLYATDRTMQLQKSQDNHLVEKVYKDDLGGGPGSHDAHKELHTYYANRSQLFDAQVPVIKGTADECLPITVTISARQDNCPGQVVLGRLVDYVRTQGWEDRVTVNAAFSSRQRVEGTVGVTIGDKVLESCRFTNAATTEQELENSKEFAGLKEVIDTALGKGVRSE